MARVGQLALTGILWSSHAQSAGPLGSNGSPIGTSNYRLEIAQGPVLSSARIVGLAGAYSALGEGADGLYSNAASPAVRSLWSIRRFDYDLTLGLMSSSALDGMDVDNNGRVSFNDGTGSTDNDERFLFLNLGGVIQYRHFGIGLALDSQKYRLAAQSDPVDPTPNMELSLTRYHLLTAYQFLHGDLAVGGGLRGAVLDMFATENANGSGKSRNLIKMSGAGFELGALWAPADLPVRLGATYRTAVHGRVENEGDVVSTSAGDMLVGARYLPTEIVLPWELELGLALQFGKRPLSRAWIDPLPVAKELLARRSKTRTTSPTRKGSLSDALDKVYARRLREVRSLSRQKLLLTASVLVSGRSADAVGVESVLSQTVERTGEHVGIQPRFGLEIEPWQHRLQLRGGSYLEVSRFNPEIARVHGTLGFDIRVLQWSVFGLYEEQTHWRVGGFGDAALRYASLGLTFGVWH